FFQADDGIRDGHVTGVQTCALPISHTTVLQVLVDDGGVSDDGAVVIEYRHLPFRVDRQEPGLVLLELVQIDVDAFIRQALLDERSEERRVGKECRWRGGLYE